MLLKQKTKVSKGNNTNRSVKTVIPHSFAQLMDLKLGDYIEWSANLKNGEIEIKIRKIEEIEE